MYRFRLATASGLSNFRPFCVDNLPEVQQSNGNHSPSTAQPVPVPCVVTGRVQAETSGFFRFTVASGQRLSFEVLGRRLGSGLDPVLRLHDVSGRVLPGAYSDDAPGLQSDARLTHTFAVAGDYVVELRDTTHKGGADYWYRLRIGDFPCAVIPVPAAVKRGTKTSVSFAGPQVEGVPPIEVHAPADPAIEAVSVAPVGPSGLPAWPVTLLLSDHDELLAGDNIGALAQAQRLNPPCGVTGRFRQKGQKDHFALAASKGQRFRIMAHTADLLSPAEVYLTIRDGAGGELARSDPRREAILDFTAPADANFFIIAEHLNYGFGPCEVYRITVTPPTPGFELALATDRVMVPQGQSALIPVATLVRGDFGGPIELRVVGPPGLTGSATIPAGVVQTEPPQPNPGEPPPPKVPPVAQLPIHASADLNPGAYEVKVMAKAVADGKELIAFASTKSVVQAQMAGLPHPPREWLRGVGIAVTPKPPFTLAALWERPQAVRGLGDSLVVVATRDAGFDGEIALAAVGPPGVTATNAVIPAGRVEAVLQIKVSAKAALGTFPFTVIGRTHQDGHTYTATLLPPPLQIDLPFALKVEPNPLALEPGGSASLLVTAVRKGGYSGPIGLELRNLPAQVTAGRAEIGAGKNSVAIRLAAAAGAPLASRGDVDVLGTAPLGGQQAASPSFTVRVQPPPALAVKVEPTPAVLKPGGKLKFKVTIERQQFNGPVSLTMAGLPAKVTIAAATIPAEQSAGEIEFTAAPDAEPGQADATLTASGSGAAAPRPASAKVIVRVEK
jgi:hypothetical protein